MLDHLVLLADEALLAHQLGAQLLVVSHHFVQLLLEEDLLLVKALLVGVDEAVREERSLVLILTGFLVSEIGYALELLGWLKLVTGS